MSKEEIKVLYKEGFILKGEATQLLTQCCGFLVAEAESYLDLPIL